MGILPEISGGFIPTAQRIERTTTGGVRQARVAGEIRFGDGLIADARACSETGYIGVRHSLHGAYVDLGVPAHVYLSVIRCLLATGGVTRQDIEALLAEAAS